MGFIKKLVHSKGYKNFMAKLYGWGASVVIIGALFKIMHYPGAGILLTVGLTTEAIIFFFSAFEPPHPEPDWSLVYPELWGIYHPDEVPEGEIAGSSHSRGKEKSITQELDKMLEEAKIGPELISSLAEGMRNLSENANKLSGVATAVGVTDQFVNNLTKASSNVEKLAEVYEKTNQSLNKNLNVNDEFTTKLKSASEVVSQTSQSLNKFAEIVNKEAEVNEEYVKSIKQATESAKKIAENYMSSAESLTKSAQAIDFSKVDGQSYSEQIQKLTKNLSALNAIYELQIAKSNEQLQKSADMQASINEMVSTIDESIKYIKKYKEQAELLANNLSALNTVYGNILSAMTFQPRN